MNRDAAIEAAANALQRIARDAHPHVAATVAVDAAAPHLVGEPVGYVALSFDPDWPIEDDTPVTVFRTAREAARHGAVVALVPIEDQP